jgi:hypothetical protein
MYKMEIERKFKEAKYFLNQVEKLEHSPEEMIYNLNAFLASSKSITAYYGKKLGENSNNWYRNIEEQFPLIGYFRLKRNVVVHHRFLDIASKTLIDHTEYITAAPAELTIELIRVDKEGNRIKDDTPNKKDLTSFSADEYQDTIETKSLENHEESPMPQENLSIGAVANSYYYFEDYPDRTVLELCKQYMDELQKATGK